MIKADSKPNTDKEKSDAARQNETAGSASLTAKEKLSEEANALCTDLERFFRRGFGDVPRATDLGELRAHQASLRELLNRASELNDGSDEKTLAAETERDKFKDAAARARADFLNYQSRAAKDLERAEELSLRRYVSELLTILDALDLARSDAASANSDPQRLKEALEMIGTSLSQTLAVRGLERIQAKGKPFDPTVHEAVVKRPADPAQGEVANTVLEELRPGYLWKGLILRPAQVMVSEPEKKS